MVFPHFLPRQSWNPRSHRSRQMPRPTKEGILRPAATAANGLCRGGKGIRPDSGDGIDATGRCRNPDRCVSLISGHRNRFDAWRDPHGVVGILELLVVSGRLDTIHRVARRPCDPDIRRHSTGRCGKDVLTFDLFDIVKSTPVPAADLIRRSGPASSPAWRLPPCAARRCAR
jgi:hypothetical protein